MIVIVDSYKFSVNRLISLAELKLDFFQMISNTTLLDICLSPVFTSYFIILLTYKI